MSQRLFLWPLLPPHGFHPKRAWKMQKYLSMGFPFSQYVKIQGICTSWPSLACHFPSCASSLGDRTKGHYQDLCSILHRPEFTEQACSGWGLCRCEGPRKQMHTMRTMQKPKTGQEVFPWLNRHSGFQTICSLDHLIQTTPLTKINFLWQSQKATLIYSTLTLDYIIGLNWEGGNRRFVTI